MATTLNFSDRFSYPATSGVGTGTDFESAQLLSDEDLEAESPELKEMAAMVRSYSVLLSRRRTLEIFNIITQQADPRIALYLAAAKKREDNLPLFAGLGAVKEVMFADNTRTPAGTGFINRNLFSDGIRRVSAALTASILIGQLSQVKEQAEHAKIIEQQALDDLERVVTTYDLAGQLSDDNNTKESKEDVPIGFYMEPKDFTIPSEKYLRVEWQAPSISNSWSLVGDYVGSVSTWEILVAIVDAINSETAVNPDTSLLTAAELSGPYLTNPINPSYKQYHIMTFYPRKPIVGTLAHSINLHIELKLLPGQTDNSATAFPVSTAPFIWGTRGDSLNFYPYNGAIVVTRFNKLSTAAASREHDDASVIYFRRSKTLPVGYEPPDMSLVKFRIQPWQPNLNQGTTNELTEIEVDIPRLTSTDPAEQALLDENRYSQVAVAVLNALAQLNTDSRVTGALIRNDPYSASEASAGIELIAWCVSKVISYVVLDILEIPEDIELATGDIGRPKTLYSPNPKSVRVKNPFSDSANGVVDAVMKKEQAFMVRLPKPRLWQAIMDESKAVEDPLWL